MARIRSIWPGFYSDEAVVSCGPWARLLVIGLWSEADDKGIFEWKPLTIKMRVFPADAHDVAAMQSMLDELLTENIIRQFEIDGRTFGAIRNFRKYQRPQKPNDIHPITDELRIYVGLKSSIPVPVRDQSTTGKRKSIQMEDGGWKKNTSMGKGTSEIVDADGVLHDDDDPVWRNHDEVQL